MGSGTALSIRQPDGAAIALPRGSPAFLFACDRLDLDVGANLLANRRLIEISGDFDRFGEVEHPLGLLQWYAALRDNFAGRFLASNYLHADGDQNAMHHSWRGVRITGDGSFQPFFLDVIFLVLLRPSYFGF